MLEIGGLALKVVPFSVNRVLFEKKIFFCFVWEGSLFLARGRGEKNRVIVVLYGKLIIFVTWNYLIIYILKL